MFWSLHATKGGVGTSVVAAALAVELAKREPWTTRHGVVLVDVGGDQGDILGIQTAGRHGLVDWLCSAEPVDVTALASLLVPVVPGLSLLPQGLSALDIRHDLDPQRINELVLGLGGEASVVCDLGVVRGAPTAPQALIGAASDRRTLVIRPCYLALRRGADVPLTFDSVVEVFEDGRALRTLDVEAVIGQPVSARVRLDPGIARAVDSGTLSSRLPRALRRCVGDLMAEHDGAGLSPQKSQDANHRKVEAW